MWDLSRSRIEPISPALTGRFLTTEPPGKSLKLLFLKIIFYFTYSTSNQQSFKFLPHLLLSIQTNQKYITHLSPITWLCGVDAEFPVEGLTFEVLLRAFFCCKAIVYLLTAFRYSLSWKSESAWYTKSWYFWDGENNSLEKQRKYTPYMGYFEMSERTPSLVST